MCSPCGTTKSCRDEVTQDQNVTADHSIEGSALWMFCIGKAFPGLQGYSSSSQHALTVAQIFRRQDLVPTSVVPPP